MKLDLVCPACGAELEAETEIGSAIVCPGCGHPFAAVPREPSAAPLPPPRGRIVSVARGSVDSARETPARVVGRDYFWNALLSIVLFFPVGLVAVAFACLAGGAREADDASRFAVYSSAARRACNAATICFLAGLVLWVGSCAVVAAVGHAAASSISAAARP